MFLQSLRQNKNNSVLCAVLLTCLFSEPQKPPSPGLEHKTSFHGLCGLVTTVSSSQQTASKSGAIGCYKFSNYKQKHTHLPTFQFYMLRQGSEHKVDCFVGINPTYRPSCHPLSTMPSRHIRGRGGETIHTHQPRLYAPVNLRRRSERGYAGQRDGKLPVQKRWRKETLSYIQNEFRHFIQ